MLRFLAFLLCRIFFKKINISGNPYTGGSAIWAANHSSGIVDPAIMLGLAPVKIRPLAKSTLWDMPVMRQILQLAQAIPVVRSQDLKQTPQNNAANSHNNSEAFAEVSKALVSGDCILIFPEGVSHDDPYIYPFKNGLARMALQTMESAPQRNFTVVIQPVIIDYAEKDEFRSELCVHYCEPIYVTSAEYGIKDIMNGVRDSMEDGFARFLNWDEKRNWRFLFEVAYGRQPISSREFRLFVEGYKTSMESDPLLLPKAQTIRRMLQVLNISALELVWGEKNAQKRNFFWRIFTDGWIHIFITLPIEFLGIVVWAFPSKMCERLAKRSTKDRDVLATMKIAHGMWFFPSWAFFVSWIFTVLAEESWPHSNHFLTWLIFLILTPVFLIISFIVTEQMNVFPSFLRLAKIRFFFPRAYNELMTEWKELSKMIFSKIDK